jgi:hypothetical protein
MKRTAEDDWLIFKIFFRNTYLKFLQMDKNIPCYKFRSSICYACFIQNL